MTRASLPHFSTPIYNETGVLSIPWTRFFDELAVRIGAGKLYNLGGLLSSSTTSVGNVGTGEDDLITYTFQKNNLVKAGDVLEITAYGSFAANANNKRVKLKIGSTTLFDTTALAFNNKDWCIKSTITRITATSQNVVSVFMGDYGTLTDSVDVVSSTEDLSTSLTIKCTGEATSDNDIVQKGLNIKLFPTTT